MTTAPRYPLEFSARLLPAKGRARRPADAVSENLSLSGMRLHIPAGSRMKVGDRIQVGLQVENDEGKAKRHVELVARVVWTKEDRCGIRIEDGPPLDLAFYESLILGYQAVCEAFADLQMSA